MESLRRHGSTRRRPSGANTTDAHHATPATTRSSPITPLCSPKLSPAIPRRPGPRADVEPPGKQGGHRARWAAGHARRRIRGGRDGVQSRRLHGQIGERPSPRPRRAAKEGRAPRPRCRDGRGRTAGAPAVKSVVGQRSIARRRAGPRASALTRKPSCGRGRAGDPFRGRAQARPRRGRTFQSACSTPRLGRSANAWSTAASAEQQRAVGPEYRLLYAYSSCADIDGVVAALVLAAVRPSVSTPLDVPPT
jgi:hypothetical protein